MVIQVQQCMAQRVTPLPWLPQRYKFESMEQLKEMMGTFFEPGGLEMHLASVGNRVPFVTGNGPTSLVNLRFVAACCNMAPYLLSTLASVCDWIVANSEVPGRESHCMELAEFLGELLDGQKATCQLLGERAVEASASAPEDPDVGLPPVADAVAAVDQALADKDPKELAVMLEYVRKHWSGIVKGMELLQTRTRELEAEVASLKASKTGEP